MAVIVKVPEKNLWEEICRDFDSRCPPFPEDDEQSVKTEYIDYDPAKHSPIFYGKMHQKISADIDPIKDIDPATSHPACAGFAFTEKPPASPPPPPPEPPHKDKCSPREYLEHYIFPWLLPAIEEMLRQAKKEKCLERKRTKFNALDYLTESLYKKNPLHKDRENVVLEEIPFVKEWLKDHPRPPLPWSLVWTEEEATQIIQNYWRGFLVRRDPEVQELRHGMCSQSCDDGILKKTRNRTCIHDDCSVDEEMTYPCNLQTCRETCNKYCSLWSGWKSSDCPVTCGGGLLPWTRVRLCDSPDCPQSETTTSPCNTQNCDEKCDLICSQWSGWTRGECSVSCDNGVSLQSRARVCSDQDCQIQEQTPVSCRLSTCPGTCDKMCSGWTVASNASCLASCETNQRYVTYTRECPYDECDIRLNLTESCNNATCGDTCDAMCTDWSEWTTDSCSVSCGEGVRNKTKSRKCPSDDCDTISFEEEQCNATNCPDESIDCDMICNEWSRWTDGPCSVTCDTGTQRANRSRTCDTVKEICTLFQTKEESCHYITCPETCDTICTQWSDWVDEVCSVTCGLGVKHRVQTRRCPQYDCLESNILMEPCEKVSCDIVNIQNDHESQHVIAPSEPCKNSTALYLPHVTDCNKFLQCVHGRAVEMSCPATTGWNPIINACDHKRNIPGCS